MNNEFLDIDIATIKNVLEMKSGALCNPETFNELSFSTEDVIAAYQYFRNEFANNRSQLLDSEVVSNKRFNTKAGLVLAYWNHSGIRKAQLANSTN